MKIIMKQYETFTFDELSDSAKQTALKNNAMNIHSDWYESVIDDTKEIASLMGIEIDNVYFSGFSSQGDGAQFIGYYEYEKDCINKIVDYAPKDEELLSIVTQLRAIQKRNFYQLYATVTHSGHYYHEMCTDFDVRRDSYTHEVSDQDEEDLKEVLRDFMVWIYSRLESEYDYLTSEDCFVEDCQANRYTFLESGQLFN